jgi:histone acetyltransferase (RNA polymerase elongator complex component)
MSVRHRNIPIFIPHLGCPNQCVFCNQRSISGCMEFHEESVREQIERGLSRLTRETQEIEIAFFGGSFTGIDRGLMQRLLHLAKAYVDLGRVSGIRISTRPDYISDEILDLLEASSVHHIELGLQSMDDRVLTATRRGHTAADAERACRAIVARGFSLTGQMMIGLPASTAESERMTARRICELGAESARIYPTVVFYDTPLCEMAMRGEYEPLTLRDAVVRAADAYEIFDAADVTCIRIGLCATEELSSDAHVYAGPNHPALGELVMSEAYYRRMLCRLEAQGLLGEKILVEVPRRELSRAIGQHRENIARLYEQTGTRVLRIRGAEHGEIRAYKADT